MLGSLLVDAGRGVVLGLVGLVTYGILGSGSTDEFVSKMSRGTSGSSGNIPSADGSIAVLGDALVGLLGGGVHRSLNGVGDVVGSVLDSVSHFDGWLVVIWVGCLKRCVKVDVLMMEGRSGLGWEMLGFI